MGCNSKRKWFLAESISNSYFLLSYPSASAATVYFPFANSHEKRPRLSPAHVASLPKESTAEGIPAFVARDFTAPETRTGWALAPAAKRKTETKKTIFGMGQFNFQGVSIFSPQNYPLLSTSPHSGQ